MQIVDRDILLATNTIILCYNISALHVHYIVFVVDIPFW